MRAIPFSATFKAIRDKQLPLWIEEANFASASLMCGKAGSVASMSSASCVSFA
jgi:hypothetical protein